MNRSAAVLTANRSVGNLKTSDVMQFVTSYIDRRSAFAAGLHSPTLTTLHAGRAPLWDRQCVLAGGHQ